MSKETSKQDAQPPIMGTWNRLYTLILVVHALIIALFYWFSIANS